MSVAVPLKSGLKIGNKTYKAIEIREPEVGDMIEAEKIASIHLTVSYRTAILEQVIVKVVGYEGHVTAEVLKRLKQRDFYALVDALNGFEEAPEEGEA